MVDKVKEEVRKVGKAISNKQNLSLKAKCARVTKREGNFSEFLL